MVKQAFSLSFPPFQLEILLELSGKGIDGEDAISIQKMKELQAELHGETMKGNQFELKSSVSIPTKAEERDVSWHFSILSSLGL